MAMARKCLSLLKKRSTRLRSQSRHEITTARHLAVGLGRNHRRDVAPFECVNEGVERRRPLSPRPPPLDRQIPAAGSAPVRSCACPGVSITSTGLPSASTRAWILVVSPPRERPIACSPFFFVRRRCAGERARWWRRSSCIRYHGRSPSSLKCARKTRSSPTD